MHYVVSRSLFAPLLLALCVASASAQSEGMAWRTDFQAAAAEAQQSGKLLLAHFWTESCGPCKALEQRVFSQPQVATAIENQYIPVKINANEAPELARAYGITRVPTDAVITGEGKLVKTFISPATPMEYVGYVSRLATAYRTQSGGAYAAASAVAPDQSMTAQATGGVQTVDFNQAYAQLVAKKDAAPAAAPAGAVANNPYTSAPQAAVPQTPSPQTPAPQVAVQAQAPITPIDTPVQPAPAQVADVAPQLPPGSPALGFEGYCPVTMKNEWRWVKGDARWGAIHRGRTYLFASDKAQKAFLGNPDAFSPVLAGSDPVSAVDERRSVAGLREFAVEYEGRFYMFSSEKTLEKFWSDPTAYSKGVQRVAALPASDTFIR